MLCAMIAGAVPPTVVTEAPASLPTVTLPPEPPLLPLPPSEMVAVVEPLVCAELATPALPPPPPVDWARMPSDIFPVVPTSLVLVTWTLSASQVPPPVAPRLTCTVSDCAAPELSVLPAVADKSVSSAGIAGVPDWRRVAQQRVGEAR